MATIATHDSVSKLLERSRTLRQRTDAMVADRRMQAFDPSVTKPAKMTSMLDVVRHEVKELRKDNKSLKLQMQLLYTAIKDVSNELTRELTVDTYDVDDGEEEPSAPGFVKARRPSLPAMSISTHREQIPTLLVPIRHAHDNDSSRTGGCISRKIVSSGAGKNRQEAWYRDLLEMRFAELNWSEQATDKASHWANTYVPQTMAVSY